MYKLLRKNFKVLVKFEIVYSVFIYFILVPFLKWLFNLSLNVTGVGYLTQENMFAYIVNPINLFVLLIIGFIIAFFSIFDYNAINIIYFASRDDKELNISSLLKLTISNSKFLFKYRSIILYLYSCLLVPFISVVYQNPIIKSLSIPEFINAYIGEHALLKMIYIVLMILFTVILVITIYVYLFMLIDQKSFLDAARKSYKLFKKTYKELIKSLAKIIISIILLVMIVFAMIYGFSYIIKNMEASAITVTLSTLFLMFQYISTLFVDIITKVGLMFCIAQVFSKNIAIDRFDYNLGNTILISKKLYRIILAVILLIVIMVTSSIAYGYIYTEDIIPDMEIVAHRGSSTKELENTEEAIIQAVNDGANIIEIDVVETKDHKIVLSHDLTTKRLTDVDEIISDLTLNELKELNMKYKGKDYHYVTLEEVLKVVPVTVKLMVELKPEDDNSKSLAFETEKVLSDTMRHMVCSLSTEALKYAQEANPYRSKGLILAFYLGNGQYDNYINFLSVEESFVNEDLIDKTHSKNRYIYVWQVNDEESIDTYLDMGVDGIITDYPADMVKALYISKSEYNNRKLMQIFNSLDLR